VKKKTIAKEQIKSAKRELKEKKSNLHKIREFIEEFSFEITRIEKGMIDVLEWQVSSGIDINSKCIDLSHSGDKLVFEGVFRALRKLGYEPDKRPEANASYFTTFWNRPGTTLRVYTRFSSTVCKRVKIGTKMVEQDIFETRCG